MESRVISNAIGKWKVESSAMALCCSGASNTSGRAYGLTQVDDAEVEALLVRLCEPQALFLLLDPPHQLLGLLVLRNSHRIIWKL